jgi:hypothetical protein
MQKFAKIFVAPENGPFAADFARFPPGMCGFPP